jgi:hypothetical protein
MGVHEALRRDLVLPQSRPFLPSGLGPLSAQLRYSQPRSTTAGFKSRHEVAPLFFFVEGGGECFEFYP